MTLDAFQKAYGQKLSRLLQSPELTAAIVMLRTIRRNDIMALSPEEIQNRSREILGEIRGAIRFENDLMTLHTKREFKLMEEAPLDYISPEEEARVQDLMEKFKIERERKSKKQAA